MPLMPRLNIITALACEARPLLSHYKMSLLAQHSSFSVFANRQREVYLIISGIGKVKAAAATSYIFMFDNEPLNRANTYHCFLNIGIAGSQHHSVGDALLVHQIVDQATQQAWYPSCYFYPKIPSFPLLTGDQVSPFYPENYMVDMEAAGFFQTATGFVTQEQIQVLKIIADNNEETRLALSQERVTRLIQAQRDVWQMLIENLLQSSQQQIEQQLSLPQGDFLQRWHFTCSQQHQLQELLRRWQVVFPETQPFSACAELSSSRAVMKKLEECLSHATYYW